MKRSAVAGALIGGIGGPVFLACLGLITSAQGKAVEPSFTKRAIFFLIVVGPIAAVVGALLGYFVRQWLQRSVTAARVILYATGLGACFGAFVLWASVGFLYSFGAIADQVGVIGWLTAFWPIVVALLPRALFVGAVCGTLTAFAVWKQSSW